MEARPTAVPEAKQVGEVQARWAWSEPAVWTERMLTALEVGGKGGIWFSLIDKVYKPRNLRAAFAKVKANQGAAGVDHQTIEMFEAHLDTNLTRVSQQLADGSYRPQVWSTLAEVNHQLESRMRENRLSGSEGGGTTRSPYPYCAAAKPQG